MKTRILLLLFSLTLIMGCEKTKFESTGTITGADLAMCACCGGYFIEIGATKYRFEKSELPSNFKFDDERLPLQVDIDWKPKAEACTEFSWIKILKIREHR